MTYEYTDKVIKYLDRQIVEAFEQMRGLVSYDELNVLSAVKDLYSSIYRLVRKMYFVLAQKTYMDARDRDLASLDEEWVDNILEGYDPVLKYIFASELERKQGRFAEALVASQNKTEEIDKAMRFVSFQSRAFAVRITDEAYIQAALDDGVVKVQWLAEHDDKTCRVCSKRDRHIYTLADLPAKPHPNCRCRLRRVK